MKNSIDQPLCVAMLLICAAATRAQDPTERTVFQEPAEYCFPQTELHREFTDAGFNIKLMHHLLIENADASAGDVYVGARFESRPGEWWLLSGNVWRSATTSGVPWPTVYVRYDDQLPPIIPVTFSYDPEAVSSLGDGEIWIGHGFRTERTPTQEAFQESFDDMMRARQYSLLWKIRFGKAPFHGEYPIDDARICLEATAMERTIIRGGSTVF